MENLLNEYREGQEQLKERVKQFDDEDFQDVEDKRILNSAIKDMDFVIEWLSVGVMPVHSLYRVSKTRVFNAAKKFVYGQDGYWDDSMGGFISVRSYSDPYEEVEERIDRELAERRSAKTAPIK